MLNERSMWALTFEIEPYIKVIDKKHYPFPNIYAMPVQTMSAALKMLFDGVFTPKELSQTIADKYNFIILPEVLSNMANGEFEPLYSIQIIKNEGVNND